MSTCMNSLNPSVRPIPLLAEVRHDVLYEAVSIFLLVRQQLQRITQIPAETLRYCMRCEDLGLVNTSACLHHQSQSGCFQSYLSADRGPPIVKCFVSQRPTKGSLTTGNCSSVGHKYDIVTPPCPPAGAMMRRELSVLLIMISWTVPSFLASFFATFSKAFLFSVKSPFHDFHFLSESFFIFFTVSTFRRDKALLHHSVRAVSVIAACLILFQVFSSWRFQLH